MDLNIFDFDDEGLVGGDQGFADDLDDDAVHILR